MRRAYPSTLAGRHYKKGDFEEAIDCYSMALEHCPEDEAHKHDRAVYLGNRAACHLQLSDVRDPEPR